MLPLTEHQALNTLSGLLYTTQMHANVSAVECEIILCNRREAALCVSLSKHCGMADRHTNAGTQGAPGKQLEACHTLPDTLRNEAKRANESGTGLAERQSLCSNAL